MDTAEEYFGKEHIEYATQEIIKQYGLEYYDARSCAISALEGLDSHGGSAKDHQVVKKVIETVVSSWIKK